MARILTELQAFISTNGMNFSQCIRIGKTVQGNKFHKIECRSELFTWCAMATLKSSYQRELTVVRTVIRAQAKLRF